jgi:hypothetical protein
MVGTIVQANSGLRRKDGQAMASVVNLNRFRKAKQRSEAERQAAENRATFGRSKAERSQADIERERRDRELDSKRIE